MPSNSSKGWSVPNYGKINVKNDLEHMFLYNFPLIFCKNHLESPNVIKLMTKESYWEL